MLKAIFTPSALPGSPWLMDAGTPRAHILFSPSMEHPTALQKAQQRARQD